MMEVLGFIFLCLLNGWFSLGAMVNFAFGGGDLGPLLSGWVGWRTKLVGVAWVILCSYFWYLIAINSPFTLTVN